MTPRKLQSILAGLVIASCIGLAQPAAAVDWSGCSVEQGGGLGLPDGTSSGTQSLDNPVLDISQAFVLLQASGLSAVTNSDRHLVTGELNSAGELVMTRVSTIGDLYVGGALVRCSGGDKFTVQRGTITLNSGSAANTATLTTAVDVDRSLVLVTTRTDDTGLTDSNNIVTAALQDATTVVIERASAATTTIYAHYQVIEFTTASGVTVQTDEVTLSAGQATNTVTLGTAAATDRTWVSCSYDASNNGLQQTAVACYLSDANTITVERATGAAYTNRIQVYAVTWPEDTVTVLSGSESINTTVLDDEPYEHDITLPAPGADIHNSFVYVTNTTTGTGTEYPRNRWISYVLDSTTLQSIFARSDPSGDSDANTKYWQVINFPPPYYATGWGWIGNSSDAINGTGLISFNCDNLTTYYGTTCTNGGSRAPYGVELDQGGCGAVCDVTGQAWIGNYGSGETPPNTTIGMIDFDPDVTSGPPVTQGDDTNTSQHDTLDAHWNEETGELYGWARFRALEDYEDGLGGTNNDWGWIKLRGTESTGGSEYGVQFDADTLAFSGWSWNDNGTQVSTTSEEEGSGFGWVKFDLDTSTPGTVGDAWLRTTQADVYSQGGFNSTVDLSTIGEYNATYLILTNGSVSPFFITESATTITEDLGGVPTDNSRSVFRGALGTIYLNELIDQADHIDTTADCNDSLLTGYTTPLGGDIFYCAGDLTISNNVTFYNGTGSDIGSGTIIVGGDLIIEDKINYANTTIDQHINNLASVAWIVQGSVQIDPVVMEVVGAFIVLGDSDPSTTGDCNFSTGDSTLPLDVHGLVMACSFNFQRTSVGTTTDPEPGEDIRYDGRVFANPPPGLEDLASVLPEFN